MIDAAGGRLLSVNVGRPRDVEWEGRMVHTGIWKDPVDGRRMLRRLNVDGDGQRDQHGHGGVNRAVFVYQVESYRYWQQFLDRDDFTYGQFGENFRMRPMRVSAIDRESATVLRASSCTPGSSNICRSS